MPLNLNARTRLLVVAPHPDDESIATGELIQQVRAAGGEVRILLLTDGDNNPWPQRWLERRLRVGPADRRRWGRRRRDEVEQALRLLGVEPAALHAFGWPDMGLTGMLRGGTGRPLQAIGACLGAYAPDIVAMPALADRHPDHGAAHVLVRLALAQCAGLRPQLLGYLVHGRETGTGGTIAPASSPALHAGKLAALERHHSQMVLSGGRMRRLAERPERYLEVAAPEGGSGTGALPWRPAAWLRPWLRLTVADADGVREWPWNRAPFGRDGEGRYVLAPAGGPRGAPRFAKLHMELPSPWIFDRWGWCEL
ncbi:GlcNAc-PI de-N-acetylase [Frateuria sp. Soil773]|uniref:PIG-L deacetylase family protein n=1 Tax=Frateuria sp. Soil773 TaxID=1736407 RepID=UPI0006F63B64|nr:PIG-L family deacetylase [Frateuria sp. Soil773]KRE93769.1 GlcNAc-PI de-N-acetylase [Frateuria sp. Soil773]